MFISFVNTPKHLMSWKFLGMIPHETQMILGQKKSGFGLLLAE